LGFPGGSDDLNGGGQIIGLSSAASRKGGEAGGVDTYIKGKNFSNCIILSVYVVVLKQYKV
jgi:hypothetical protein